MADYINFYTYTVYFITIFGVGYLLLAKRGFDLWSLAFVSCCFYFMPAYFGFVLYPGNDGSFERVPISPYVYLVYIYLMTISVVLMFMKDILSYGKSSIHNYKSDEKFKGIGVVSVVCIIIFLIFLVTSYDELFSPGKPTFGRLHPYFQVTTSILLVVSVLNKSLAIFLLSLAFLFLDVYGGNREGLAMAAMAASLVYFKGRRNERMMHYWKPLMLMVVLAFFLVFYKGAYVAIQAGEYELVISRLLSSAYYMEQIAKVEPFITQMILVETINNDVSYPYPYFSQLLLNFVVMGNEFFESYESYGRYFNSTFLSHLNYGTASNYWAEGYAVMGWFGVFFMSAIFFSVIAIYDYLITFSKGYMSSAVALLGAYFVFFLHRTGLIYQVTIQRRILIAAVFMYLIFYILRYFSKLDTAKALKHEVR